MPTRERCDLEGLQRADAHQGSNALLARLIEHHDYSMQKPIVLEEESAPPKLDPVKVEPEEDPAKTKLDRWLKLLAMEGSEEPLLLEIKCAVCVYFGLRIRDLDSMAQIKKIVYPRQIGYFLAREMTTKSLPQIGKIFGKRDHTTILHGIKKIERLIQIDPKVAHDVEQVRASI